MLIDFNAMKEITVDNMNGGYALDLHGDRSCLRFGIYFRGNDFHGYCSCCTYRTGQGH